MNISPARTITFVKPLVPSSPGLQYALEEIEEAPGFCTLTGPELRFHLMDARLVAGYAPLDDLPKDRTVRNPAVTLVIVSPARTAEGNNATPTVNLVAPIIIDAFGTAEQVILLHDYDYPLRHPFDTPYSRDLN